jgi:hypothetical protein
MAAIQMNIQSRGGSRPILTNWPPDEAAVQERFIMSKNNAIVAGVIAPSCPGGMARQFRVQVKNRETPSHWKLVGSFGDWHEATACASKLAMAGEQIRVVACRALPTAA